MNTPVEEGVDGARRHLLQLGAFAALAATGCGSTGSLGGSGDNGNGASSSTSKAGSTSKGSSAAAGSTTSTSVGNGSQPGGGGTGSSTQGATSSNSSAGGGGGGTGGATDAGGSSDATTITTSDSGSGSTGMTGMGWQESNCTPVTTLPDGTHGPSQPKCPDPFKFINGTRISSKADWECLRADLSAMLQAAVYGPKMPPPDKLTATMSGTTVTVNCTVGSKSGSFTFTIKGGNKSSPTAGVVRIAQSGNPFPSSVATIDFDEHQFAQENKMWPTTGLVTTLYGNTAAKSGSDICWAWGASRIIDALIQLGNDMTGVNWQQLAVTGCSFAGKGAFASGAFDERFVLVAPEEAGSGGAALWRV
ncbi:MAG: hypothetical protein FWD17_04425 [Polyangiaceae bacterium]|nr:hypothetical protein [Polyangiaceae bacterium]